MATDVGTGTTIAFTHTSKPIDVNAELTSIEWSGRSNESIETTHMGSTTARSFIKGDLYDPGEIQLEGHFDATEADPNFSESNTITIDWAGSGQTNAVTGFLTDYSVSAGLEDKMTFSATFKASGVVT